MNVRLDVNDDAWLAATAVAHHRGIDLEELIDQVLCQIAESVPPEAIRTMQDEQAAEDASVDLFVAAAARETLAKVEW